MSFQLGQSLLRHQHPRLGPIARPEAVAVHVGHFPGKTLAKDAITDHEPAEGLEGRVQLGEQLVVKSRFRNVRAHIVDVVHDIRGRHIEHPDVEEGHVEVDVQMHRDQGYDTKPHVWCVGGATDDRARA